MNKSYFLGTVCAVLLAAITVSANAALLGVLPETPGGTDWQAYFDDQLNITWATDTRILGTGSWSQVKSSADTLTINGVGGWRLGSIDEYIFQYNQNGITTSSPSPFTNLDASFTWSSSGGPVLVDVFAFRFGSTGTLNTSGGLAPGWAVADGNVGVVPVPAAVWLFISALLCLVGIASRKKAA